MKPLTILDLFSGIGGFSYAAEVLVGGFKTIGFCEYDKKCQEVLKLRFPGVPIYPDIRELNEETLGYTAKQGLEGGAGEGIQGGGNGLAGNGDGNGQKNYAPIHADIITGGYPCQPFSQAGKRGGEDDDRHLWPEMFRVIQLIKPKYVICENVAGHISMGLNSVLSDLESEGYTTEVFILPACAVDAKHRRDRVWIMGYAQHDGQSTKQKFRGNETSSNQRGKEKQAQTGKFEGADRPRDAEGIRRGKNGKQSTPISNTNNAGSGQRLRVDGNGQEKDQGRKGQSFTEFSKASEDVAQRSQDDWGQWLTEPSVGRVAHGISGRVDRLKQLGNSIVPQVAAQLFRAIKEVENATHPPTK